MDEVWFQNEDIFIKIWIYLGDILYVVNFYYFISFLFNCIEPKNSTSQILIIPQPSELIISSGQFALNSSTGIQYDDNIKVSAEVLNIHTIKPLDDQAILESVSKTGCIVSAEEHNFLGGLGESVARVLALNKPTPQEFVATNDTFGESGTPTQLMEKYGLNSDAITKKVIKVISRK